MLFIKRIFISFIFLISAVNLIYAQETQTRLPELHSLIGKWNVTSENRLSATGPWETNKAIAVIKISTGNAVVEEEYTGTLNRKSFFTKTLLSFNHFSSMFQRCFVDSEHGVLIDYQGEKKGDTILFDKLWTYPNGSTVKLRVVYAIISSDEFTILNMRMPDNNSAWDTTGRMHYVRIK